MKEKKKIENGQHTNNHTGELEALFHRLAVDLIGQIRKTNVACKLLAHNRNLHEVQ